VFTCNHCGESLKKNNVAPHSFRCKRNISVSCMDCFKDFNGESVNAHTQCKTELERYSGKDYVAKANQNKGQKKQEAWVDLVRSITETKKNLSGGVTKILETISSYDNIPRKKAKFLNFMKNSFRYMKVNELEEAWILLEEAMKENKAENAAANQNGASSGTEGNGKTSNGHTNGSTNEKRKLENDNEESSINGNTDNASEPAKKKMKNNGTNGNAQDEPAIESSEKFSWTETIRNILSAKNNELKLKKLKRKVLKKYQSLTGAEWSEKVENKFNKKINKLKGVVVEDEKVRLIE